MKCMRVTHLQDSLLMSHVPIFYNFFVLDVNRVTRCWQAFYTDSAWQYQGQKPISSLYWSHFPQLFIRLRRYGRIMTFIAPDQPCQVWLQNVSNLDMNTPQSFFLQIYCLKTWIDCFNEWSISQKERWNILWEQTLPVILSRQFLLIVFRNLCIKYVV